MSATTFSYAQAARGRTVSQPSQQSTSSPAPSTTGSQGKDDVSTGATSVTAPSVASNGAEVRDADQASQPRVHGGLSKQDSEASSVVGSGSSTVSVTEQSGKAAQDGGVKAADVQNRSDDKGSRSTSRTSRFNDGADGKKGRKGKKGRASDKDAQSEQNKEEDTEKVKEVPKPVVLTEAPPPAVNPWAKRMEAQNAAAKAKLSTSPPDVPAVGNDSKQGPRQEESGTHSIVPNGVSGDKWAARKPVETPRPAEQAARRNGPRGSRAGDKDEKNPVSLPPAADPSSWPDPKSAAARDQSVRKPQERTETTEKESQDETGPTRKKTWEKLEIVHSVVFETQLPPRSSKPRGGARGGREAGSTRGSNANAASVNPHSTANPVSDKAPSVAASTAPRTAVTRPREGSVPTRSTSQPQPSHASKRVLMDAATRDPRKSSLPVSAADQAREMNLEAPYSSKRVGQTRDIRTETVPSSSDIGQASARTLPHERTSLQTRSDYAKDGGPGAISGPQYSSRDGRPERGRGGGYRGRGGHNGVPSHLASPSYAPNGHYPPPGGFPPRQNPSAHSPPPFSSQFPTSFAHAPRGRGNKWTGSAQSAGRNNSGAAGFPPKAAQVTTDFAVAQYPPYLYSPVFDTSIAILKSQVEYYLSVENLCKDYYLRQHMDGQGFVHFSTIAGFKRIKTVTEDLELLRLACSLSDQIEFVTGDDGIERLRLRDKWSPFVLPISDRLEAYRNNGPASWTPHARLEPQYAPFPVPLVPQPYGPAAAGGFPGFSEEQMFQPAFVNGAHYDPVVNGGVVNGHHHGRESQLSAGVPEYAPPQSHLTLESMTNFSDSQVENLMMILSYEEKGDSESRDAAGVAGYVSENPNASRNGISPRSPEVQSVDKGAANGPPNAEPRREADQPERGIVWVDGQASASVKAQRDRKPYDEIRQAALEQRQSAKPGETPREMQKLYKFWSQMLLNDFNAKVYREFRELALEDASREAPLRCGLKYLLEFYEKLLLETNTRKPWPQGRAAPEIFTAHFNEAVELHRKSGGKDVATI